MVLYSFKLYRILHDDAIKWKHFSCLLVLYEGNPPVTDGFPSQRPVTRSFDIFFEQAAEQTIETPMILGVIALIMTLLWWIVSVCLTPSRNPLCCWNRNISG